MQLMPECLNALKHSEYRLRDNNLEQEKTEHSRFRAEIETILKYYDETSETGKEGLQLLKKVP
ncbi:2592_t:CDS:2, partial [Cetraspora pellucida]